MYTDRVKCINKTLDPYETCSIVVSNLLNEQQESQQSLVRLQFETPLATPRKEKESCNRSTPNLRPSTSSGGYTSRVGDRRSKTRFDYINTEQDDSNPRCHPQETAEQLFRGIRRQKAAEEELTKKQYRKKTDFYEKLKAKISEKLSHLQQNYMIENRTKKQEEQRLKKIIQGCQKTKHYRKKDIARKPQTGEVIPSNVGGKGYQPPSRYRKRPQTAISKFNDTNRKTCDSSTFQFSAVSKELVSRNKKASQRSSATHRYRVSSKQSESYILEDPKPQKQLQVPTNSEIILNERKSNLTEAKNTPRNCPKTSVPYLSITHLSPSSKQNPSQRTKMTSIKNYKRNISAKLSSRNSSRNSSCVNSLTYNDFMISRCSEIVNQCEIEAKKMTKIKKTVNDFGYFCSRVDNALFNRKTMIEEIVVKTSTLSDEEREPQRVKQVC